MIDLAPRTVILTEAVDEDGPIPADLVPGYLYLLGDERVYRTPEGVDVRGVAESKRSAHPIGRIAWMIGVIAILS